MRVHVPSLAAVLLQLLSWIAFASATGIAIAAEPALAAEHRASAHEEWSGTYQCGPIAGQAQEWRAYTAAVKLTLNDGTSVVTNTSPRFSETMTGKVADDGTVVLTGTGMSKDKQAQRWRFRFTGKFDGNKFTASGAMLAAKSASELRKCSMALTRVSARRASRRAVPAAVAQVDPPSHETPAAAPAAAPLPSRDTVATTAAESAPSDVAATGTEGPSANAVQDAPTAETQLPSAPSAATSQRSEKTLSMVGDGPVIVQGTIPLGTLHRYEFYARKGQTLLARLQSGDARLEVHAPVETIRIGSSNFLVQGSRLDAPVQARKLEARLLSDGVYLLLVRGNADQAQYALNVSLTDDAGGATDKGNAIVAALLLVLVTIGAVAVLYRVWQRHPSRRRKTITALAAATALATGVLYYVAEYVTSTNTKESLAAKSHQAVDVRAESSEQQSARELARSAFAGATYVCSEDDETTNRRSTTKLFPDGVFIELTHSLARPAIGVRFGTFDVEGDFSVVLAQAAVSSNIEGREPFLKTASFSKRRMTGDLALRSSERAGEICMRNDDAGAAMDRLRQALQAGEMDRAR